MGGCRRLRRRMEREGLHEQRVSVSCDARDFAVRRDGIGNFSTAKDAVAVGARRDAQRTIGLAAVVKMKAHGEKVLEDCARWARIVDAVFYRGQIELWSRDPAGERKHQILVPGDLPVRAGGFVESDRLKGDGGFRNDHIFGELSDQIPSGFRDRGIIQ